MLALSTSPGDVAMGIGAWVELHLTTSVMCGRRCPSAAPLPSRGTFGAGGEEKMMMNGAVLCDAVLGGSGYGQRLRAAVHRRTVRTATLPRDPAPPPGQRRNAPTRISYVC